MSDTPRTDQFVIDYDNKCRDNTPIEWAQQLERELTAVTRERDALHKERDDAWKDCKALSDRIEKFRENAQRQGRYVGGVCTEAAGLRAEVERLTQGRDDMAGERDHFRDLAEEYRGACKHHMAKVESLRKLLRDRAIIGPERG